MTHGTALAVMLEQMNSSSAALTLPATRPPPAAPDPAGAMNLALDLAEVAIELAENPRSAPVTIARVRRLILELRGR